MIENAPSTNGKKLFQPGNKASPGNPLGRNVWKWRRALIRAVSAEELYALARKLLKMGMDGDVAAAKLLLDYTVGKPAESGTQVHAIQINVAYATYEPPADD